MINRSQSTSRLMAMAAVLVALGFVWTYRQMHSVTTSLNDAAISANKCLELRDGIVSLREGSSELNWLAPSNYQPDPAIEQALRASKIEFADLSVTATAGHGVPDSDYVEVPIGMPTVENVTPEPTITFLSALAEGPTRHQINEIRLTAHKAERTISSERPTWNLECQISYFAPQKKD